MSQHHSTKLLDLYRQIKAIRDEVAGDETSTRHSLYPANDMTAIEATMRLEADHWTAHELDFSGDRWSFENILNEDERKALLAVVGFLHFADGVFVDDVMVMMQMLETDLERQRYYTAQADQERIHAEAYELQLVALLPDTEKRNAIRNRVDKMGSVKNMHAFMDEISDCTNIVEVYLRIAITEFLMFTPLFAIIFWFRHNRGNAIKDIINANNFIIRDEANHCITTAHFYDQSPAEMKPSIDEVHKIIHHVCGLLDAFVDEYYGDLNLSGMTSDDIKNYVRIISNRLLVILKYEPIYETTDTLSYMSTIGLQPKTNHYENRTTEYAKYNVTAAIDRIQDMINHTSIADNSSDDAADESFFVEV